MERLICQRVQRLVRPRMTVEPLELLGYASGAQRLCRRHEVRTGRYVRYPEHLWQSRPRGLRPDDSV